MSDYVSQREFAKHIGRSHVWVNRLVKDGRLPANNRGQIPLEAGLEAYEHSQQPGDDGRREWAEQYRQEIARKTAAKKAAKKTAAKKTQAKKAVKAAAKQAPVVSQPSANDDLPVTGGQLSVANVNAAFNRARLAEKTYQAKLKELEFKEASGELIAADDVQHDAEKTGAEVRERLMSVPPRIAGVCEGKPAREIERIVEEAINEALQALQRARFGKRK